MLWYLFDVCRNRWDCILYDLVINC